MAARYSFRVGRKDELEDNVLISMFRNSRVITFCFDGRHIDAHLDGHQHDGTSNTKLDKFGLNTFPNNAPVNNHTDRNLGEVAYTSIVSHIRVS